MVSDWRLIEEKGDSASWNMALDEALLRTYDDNDRPIFRLYEWEKALSFGRFSKPEALLHLDRMEQEGIASVRRITGGGILVHGGDISYALFLPRRFVASRGVKESYRYLCSFLLRFYHKLGLDAAFAQEQNISESHTPICLAGREAYDIIIEGCKIGGNAQHYTHQALLQHGSIPMRLDTVGFKGCFSTESGLEEAASLEKLGIKWEKEAIKALLKQSFEEAFGVTLRPDTLRDDEWSTAERLHDEKYSREAWNVHAQSTSYQA